MFIFISVSIMRKNFQIINHISNINRLWSLQIKSTKPSNWIHAQNSLFSIRVFVIE